MGGGEAVTNLCGESRTEEKGVKRLMSKNKKSPQGRRGPKANPEHFLRQQRWAGPLQVPPQAQGDFLWSLEPCAQ